MDTAPRVCGSVLNSALSFWPEPPLPVPVGSPVWAMKPSMTRWNTHAVIEALARQFLDAGDMAGREVGAHLDRHAAFGGLDDQGVVGFCHDERSLLPGSLFHDGRRLDVIELGKRLGQIGVALCSERALVWGRGRWARLRRSRYRASRPHPCPTPPCRTARSPGRRARHCRRN